MVTNIRAPCAVDIGAGVGYGLEVVCGDIGNDSGILLNLKRPWFETPVYERLEDYRRADGLDTNWCTNEESGERRNNG